jgi:hypothetical protein
LINKIEGSWKPTCKSQAHKHIVLHFVALNTQHPLCDRSRTPYDLAPNRVTTTCPECKKLLVTFSQGILRKCRVCGIEAHNERELELFRFDKTMIFQRTNTCISCFERWSHNYSIENREQIIEKTRERREKNPGYNKNWRKNTHGAAHMAARRKVKRVTACCICGFTESLVRHHPDYSKPKDVIILCRSCHAKVHIKKLTVSLDGTAHLVDSGSLEATA